MNQKNITIQNVIVKIFDKSEMQRLKSAFNKQQRWKNKNKKIIIIKTKTTQAKRLLSNNQSLHRSSLNQLNNQPSVTAKEWKIHTIWNSRRS